MEYIRTSSAIILYNNRMIKMVIYKNSSDMPSLIRQQVVDLLRIVWPDGFQEKNRLRDWISREDYHPIYFVLVEKNILISHAAVVWKYIKHRGTTYKVYALSGLFTYPQFR